MADTMADTSYCSVLQFYVDLLSICLSPIRLFCSIHIRMYNIKIYLPFLSCICHSFEFLPPTSIQFFNFSCLHYSSRPLTKTRNNIRCRLHPETFWNDFVDDWPDLQKLYPHNMTPFCLPAWIVPWKRSVVFL
jgi:hypothetical protein